MRFLGLAVWAGLLITLGGGGMVTTARAGAPSITVDMPPEIESWRELILPRDAYEELAGQWRAYLEEHPESGVAYVELSRALRYAGTASMEERNELIRKAYEVDPDCPEVLEALAGSCLHSEDPLVESCEEGSALGRRAVEIAPDWPDPHFVLWSNAIVLGDGGEARSHLRALLDKGAFGAPVLDFGYNLLMSAERGGVIFTNGDNDTYPPLALQVARELRPDVLIVNLSMLNRLEYAETVWQGFPRGERPFSDAEIRKLHDTWKQGESSDNRFSGAVTRTLAEKVAMGTWKNPVYFAVTVAGPVLQEYEGRLELEGLLFRLTREPLAGGGEEDPPMNAGRTLELFREDFRLDSATDLAYNWRPGNAAGMLLRNYVALLRLVATHEAEAGDLADARFALRKAIVIADFHGDSETVQKLAMYWRELEPDNPEVDRWL